jgi:hypothetical protein
MTGHRKISIEIAASPCEAHPFNANKQCTLFSECRDEQLACRLFTSYVAGREPPMRMDIFMPSAEEYERNFKETWTVEDEDENDGA